MSSKTLLTASSEDRVTFRPIKNGLTKETLCVVKSSECERDDFQRDDEFMIELPNALDLS